MGLWAIIILAFLAYVFADAAFDISKKISAFLRLRAWPFIRRAGGAVVGVARKRAAPAAPNPVINPPNPSDQTPPNKPIRLPSIGEVLGFFWDHKVKLLALAALLVVWSIFGDFRLPWQPSRDTLRAELKEARTENAVLAHEAALEKLAGERALETERDAARVDRVIEQANQDIEDAVEADDFDRLYRAYELGVCSVLHYAECADRPDPAPRRAAPVPSPRSLGA